MALIGGATHVIQWMVQRAVSYTHLDVYKRQVVRIKSGVFPVVASNRAIVEGFATETSLRSEWVGGCGLRWCFVRWLGLLEWWLKKVWFCLLGG